jgi:hypothetical protein
MGAAAVAKGAFFLKKLNMKVRCDPRRRGPTGRYNFGLQAL